MGNWHSSLLKNTKIKYLSIIPLISLFAPLDFFVEGLAQESTTDKTSINTVNTKSDKVNLLIENLAVERSVTGVVEVRGDIKNNSTMDLHEIKLSVEYFDKNGATLGKMDHYITQPSKIIKPGEKTIFDLLEVIAFHKLDHYNLVASGKPIN